MAQQPSCQSHLPSRHIYSDLQTASREFGLGCLHRHRGSMFKNRLRWKEEKEAGDVRRQGQLEESLLCAEAQSKKKKKELKKGTQSVSRWSRKGEEAEGRCVGWGCRVPGSSPGSIFDASAHFHYFWMDADEGSSRQSGTKVHLSRWPTLAATKRALWGGFRLMDRQQRLLGCCPTAEPIDILAFGEEQGKKKQEKQKTKIQF